MRIENFLKLKRSDHSPKRDEFIDVSLDPSYFSLDSPFKGAFVFLAQASSTSHNVGYCTNPHSFLGLILVQSRFY